MDGVHTQWRVLLRPRGGRFKKLGGQSGYVTGAQHFGAMESVAQSIYTALGTPENDRPCLRQFLSGDSVVFRIRKV